MSRLLHQCRKCGETHGEITDMLGFVTKAFYCRCQKRRMLAEFVACVVVVLVVCWLLG